MFRSNNGKIFCIRKDFNMKVHKISLRLRNNAGMNFPVCYTGRAILDTDKSRLPLTQKIENVSCKKCIAKYNKNEWI